MTAPKARVVATVRDVDADKSSIRISGLRKTYHSRRESVTAIDEMTLDFESGEFVSVVGPSGCGKSSLLLCVAGLTGYDAGTIQVGGHLVDGPLDNYGIVFQDSELLDWRTSLRNVLLPVEMRRLATKDYKDRAIKLLGAVGLGEFLDRYPWELSGGMRQRVALCRALIRDPKILLMDEPFGAVDAITRDKLNVDLQRIWLDSRKTVFFVTHSIEEAIFLSDRVIVLSPRPASVALDLRIDISRPRLPKDRDSEVFAEHAASVRATFDSLGVFQDDGLD